MVHIEVPQKWKSQTEGRSCGSCYACCVYLGIEELKKHSNQTCKHLKGGVGPTKRCSIYLNRPTSCSSYSCFWLEGWGPEELHPYNSGILITGYPSRVGTPDMASMTVIVFDAAKAKPYVMDVVGELVLLPMIDEVRLIYLQKKKVTMFRDGLVYNCKLLPPDGYESLMFMADDRPIGRYKIE